jgi:hypothetical protein
VVGKNVLAGVKSKKLSSKKKSTSTSTLSKKKSTLSKAKSRANEDLPEFEIDAEQNAATRVRKSDMSNSNSQGGQERRNSLSDDEDGRVRTSGRRGSGEQLQEQLQLQDGGDGVRAPSRKSKAGGRGRSSKSRSV